MPSSNFWIWIGSDFNFSGTAGRIRDFSAVPDGEFNLLAVLKSRFPIRELRLSLPPELHWEVHPVQNVAFPEAARLLPDLLLPETLVEVAENTCAAFVIGGRIPGEMANLVQEFTVTAHSANHPTRERKFRLHVAGRQAVTTAEQKCIFWPHWDTFCQYYHLELWSEEFWRRAEIFLKKMTEAGMNVIMASVCHDPFRYPIPQEFHAFNHYPSMVRWIRHGDRSWSFDYSIYDRYVELNMRLGIDREIECHAMLPSNLQNPVLSYFDDANHLIHHATTCRSAEYREAWGCFLRDFAAHNRRRGWERLLTICPYDEPLDPASFISSVELVRANAPEIRITCAISSRLAVRVMDYIDIATVHGGNSCSRAALRKLRAAGVETRWYNCCTPVWGNTLFASELSDSYRMPFITLANGFQGYLRWSIIDWTRDVLTNPGFNWPTGDTHLLYPGGDGTPLESLRFLALKRLRPLRYMVTLIKEARG